MITSDPKEIDLKCEQSIWGPDDIPVEIPFHDMVKEWAECGRSSENIWGVINFLSHFKKDKYIKKNH